ncbi:MAG: AAA family ATPase, partial [Alphaproteobacteria bacterium]|nr:AAA family ATPase [Alphaproteobacteria bacterium]
FRNVILIMTTNAGAADLAKEAIGFGRSERTGDDTEAINKMFTPEFRNRLDATIGFAGLSPAIIARVVEKFIMQLEVQLEDRNVTIEMTDKARTWIGEKGYDKHYGARPLGRMIQEHIKKPLAEELLFGSLVKGGLVKIGLKDGKLTFKYGAEEKAKPSKPRKPGTPKGKSGGGGDGSKVPELVQ